jgi:phosphoribosylformimino-5-aminoimidazole carboxamide ribotide isomerase
MRYAWHIERLSSAGQRVRMISQIGTLIVITMQIVPVIDLKHGQVVRGLRGQRSNYRPIESSLCHSCDPLVVASTLLDYCASNTLYIADLDALEGGAAQIACVEAVLREHPMLELWLDAGFRSAEDFAALRHRLGAPGARLVPVYASESLADAAAMREALADPAHCILSLDRHDERLLDPAGCWQNPGLWPARVIVMLLERVGSYDGPALEAFADIRDRAPQSSLIGAGGIRDESDLVRAAAAGATAWLTASALHDRRIRSRQCDML